MEPFDLPLGKRYTIVGRTGTGKSTLARRIASATDYHWVVFNPKGTKAFAELDDAKVLNDREIRDRDIRRSFHDHKYTILNFGNRWRQGDMDTLLLWFIETYENFGILADELYTLNINSRAGPGLLGLVTRGRELGQSLIACSQRPARCDPFVFSECDYVAEFQLTRKRDRETMFEATGCDHTLQKWPGHDFLYFDVDDDRATVYRA